MLSLRNLRVLLVEDDPELARTVERVFARYDHVTTVTGSVAAAEALEESFDCAILDIDLPDGSGVKLAEQLLDRGQVGAVVFFSANTRADVLAEAAALGPFVAKSDGTHGLLRGLADALSRAARQVAGGTELAPASVRRARSGSRRKTNGHQ
jgi:DNA-binding response OmpR family regulator